MDQEAASMKVSLLQKAEEGLAHIEVHSDGVGTQASSSSLTETKDSDDDDYYDYSCTNTDNGAVDNEGDNCEAYTDGQYGCSGSWDDGDFTAQSMCCHCGGGEARCPKYYPVCESSEYCDIQGATSPWERAPSATTNPSGTNYNYIFGSDNAGNGCTGDYQEATVSAASGVATSPFVQQTEYAEIPEGGGVKDADGDRAVLAFSMVCTGSATATFEAEIIAPDGGADSFYLRLDDESLAAWHTGQGDSWFWSDVSPSVSVTAGTHTVNLYGREDGIKIRTLRFASGQSEAGCEWQASSSSLTETKASSSSLTETKA
jgi:hypothetical protein